MTDEEFQRLLNQTSRAFAEYKALLEAAEQEYEKRFGFHPTVLNDERWIDSLHFGFEKPIVEELKDSAEIHLDLYDPE